MSEKIVYILGAGFSAPLGLPVMSNFLLRSKDLYFSDPEKYKGFRSVFDVIKELSVSKSYYKADLFNIEEILSIIEMGTFLEGKRLRKVFIQYISDVIEFYTPEIKPYPNQLPGNWHEFIFGENSLVKNYGFFVANLLGLEFQQSSAKVYGEIEKSIHVTKINQPSAKYAIITLNYDLVLENFCSFMGQQYNVEKNIEFNSHAEPGDWLNPPLAKLHGSLDTGQIVPPTWARGNDSKITPIWKHAYQILRDANHIRIIGYSLPVADSYIKFLLKSAVIKAEHLKSIDVICKDLDGAVKARFDDFIEFNYYTFANADVADYLANLSEMYRPVTFLRSSLKMADLEAAHNGFMTKINKPE